MTAPASASPPPLRATFPALYRLFLRNQITVGRLLAIGSVGAISVLLGVAVRVSQDPDVIYRSTRLVDTLGLTVLAPLCSLVFASSTLGDLTDDRTLAYLWLRPVKRGHIAAGAAAAAFTVSLPLVALPLVATAAVSGAGASLIGATAVASLVATAGYVGVFTAFGLRFKRALVWGVAYILLWEGFVALAGRTASRLALRAYTRSVLSEYTGVGLKLATLPLWAALVVPPAVGVLLVVYAGRRLARQDVD